VTSEKTLVSPRNEDGCTRLESGGFCFVFRFMAAAAMAAATGFRGVFLGGTPPSKNQECGYDDGRSQPGLGIVHTSVGEGWVFGWGNLPMASRVDQSGEISNDLMRPHGESQAWMSFLICWVRWW
jgi:hypothetical protein